MSYHDDEIERREASLWKGVLLIIVIALGIVGAFLVVLWAVSLLAS